jgi:hypothetical protein
MQLCKPNQDSVPAFLPKAAQNGGERLDGLMRYSKRHV